MSEDKTREIEMAASGLKARVMVPGSKSITQRALIAAALASGRSRLETPLDSEDTRLLRQALAELGILFEERETHWEVEGGRGRISPCSRDLYMGNNGTGIRFLASLVALGAGRYVLTGTDRMSERPIEPLLASLRAWKADAGSLRGNGCPPVKIVASGLEGGKTVLKAEKSSQFLSSLLLVGPYTRKPAVISLDGGLVSRPYVDLTIEVMRAFGVPVEERDSSFFIPQKHYQATDYPVEGDASSASYFWAAAAVTGGSITVENIPPDALQGDARVADLLGDMGCTVKKDPGGVTVQGPESGGLKGIEVDMGKWPDMVPTIAVTAAFATGTTVIRNVAHLRIKETDRLKAVAAELGKMGARVTEMDDGLVVEGGHELHGAEIQTYDDHRIAMSFAVAGLRVPGVLIRNPECVKKSFPGFWELWQSLGR